MLGVAANSAKTNDPSAIRILSGGPAAKSTSTGRCRLKRKRSETSTTCGLQRTPCKLSVGLVRGRLSNWSLCGLCLCCWVGGVCTLCTHSFLFLTKPETGSAQQKAPAVKAGPRVLAVSPAATVGPPHSKWPEAESRKSSSDIKRKEMAPAKRSQREK